MCVLVAVRFRVSFVPPGESIHDLGEEFLRGFVPNGSA